MIGLSNFMKIAIKSIHSVPVGRNTILLMMMMTNKKIRKTFSNNIVVRYVYTQSNREPEVPPR